ncbi:DNA polymerase subunit Cdc27 [Lentinula edodes]|uniref:DNA polymerase delta subunit 3 n=1 Tax=Lentinula lateritia TaxID=40482 RepID=A0A9W9A573_9AGAR|nr:DNA polymerase subunit Cdc27 [Lentinula edodes]
MGSQSAEDFLTKQILIEGNIITYRSLSRQLSLHVNAAKNALATFHMKARKEGESKAAATYLVSGKVQLNPQESDTMVTDVDMDEENIVYDYDGAEEAPLIEVVLVGEKDLELTKSKFSTIYSIHIYSLSPAPILDMGLICGPNEIVRDIDNKKGSEMAAIAGKIVGNVKEGKGKPYVQIPPPPPAATASTILGSKSSVSVSTESDSITRKSTSTSEKPKRSDFFAKVKPKEVAKKEKTAKEEFSKPKAKTNAATSKISEPEEKPSKVGRERKREFPPESEEEKIKAANTKGKAPANYQTGHKRKSPDSETETESPSVAVKKNVIVSDEEEDQSTPKTKYPKGGNKGKQAMRGSDEDVLAMMDVDDDQVIRVSRSKAYPDLDEAVNSETEDVKMQDHTDSKPAPQIKKKATKVKRIVPIGRNGLRKKRVMKSKMTVDQKGYMVTEDYSAYESVEEEVPDSEPAKGKGKQRKGAPDKAGGTNKSDKTETPRSKKVKDEEEEKVVQEDIETPSTNSKPAPKPKLKASTSTGSRGSGASASQKNIASFFGKSKGSK